MFLFLFQFKYNLFACFVVVVVVVVVFLYVFLLFFLWFFVCGFLFGFVFCFVGILSVFLFVLVFLFVFCCCFFVEVVLSGVLFSIFQHKQKKSQAVSQVQNKCTNVSLALEQKDIYWFYRLSVLQEM